MRAKVLKMTVLDVFRIIGPPNYSKKNTPFPNRDKTNTAHPRVMQVNGLICCFDDFFSSESTFRNRTTHILILQWLAAAIKRALVRGNKYNHIHSSLLNLKKTEFIWVSDSTLQVTARKKIWQIIPRYQKGETLKTHKFLEALCLSS